MHTVSHSVACSSPCLPIPPALRTLRTLRSISFFKGLQVLVKALIQTFRTAVLHLLLLLLVLMFLFAVMGYYFFGYDSDADKEHWGDFGRAMLSLFAFVTVGTAGCLVSHVALCVCGVASSPASDNQW